MHIGHMLSDVSPRKLAWVAQLGVEHIVLAGYNNTSIENSDGTFNVAAIKEVQARCREFGISLDVMTLGMEARLISQARFPGIVLGLPSRDAEIELVKQRIRAAGEAGVPCLKYNFTLLGVPRTGRTVGRGGARYSHFNIAEWTDHSLTEAGVVTPDMVWDRMTYFLDRVIPVAEEAGVKLACHPHDPAVPHDKGLRGIHRVLGSVEGLKKFLSLAPSKYHGLNFCQGTVAEMCVNPATEVLDAIRYFGSQKKIFMVHFRNIKGGFLNFDEVYPDNGDVDFLKAAQVYKEVGYDGMLCPDHVPQSDADPDGERQFSFCLGYTKALIQVVNSQA